ncbi:MAG TPA: iron-sulfur cluster assembly scaffold protein [Pyrinomonadaceae bacterium]|nr:iron-sulfur cluster assembly scaffold protein [Pyrinomonadaceae bacterium]
MPALYSDILLDHFRHPRNYGDLTAPDITYENVNPLCGDRIRIEIRVNDSIVEEARFKGDGCAISLAAASLLTELIRGIPIDELSNFSNDRLITALESEIKPARIACALLPLEALRAGLKAYTSR